MNVIDPTNNPSLVKIGDKSAGAMFQLSRDVIISINGKKIIAESKILDGETLFERILQEPYKVDFEFTFREVKSQPGKDATENNAHLKDSNYVFPAAAIENFLAMVWKPNKVLDVTNTYLNSSLGIFQLIVEELPDITPVRGSKNVNCRLSCIENYYSNSQFTTSLVQ